MECFSGKTGLSKLKILGNNGEFFTFIHPLRSPLPLLMNILPKIYVVHITSGSEESIDPLESKSEMYTVVRDSDKNTRVYSKGVRILEGKMKELMDSFMETELAGKPARDWNDRKNCITICPCTVFHCKQTARILESTIRVDCPFCQEKAWHYWR